MKIFNRIKNWAKDRELLCSSKAPNQMVKLIEELGELSAGMLKNQPEKVLDSIGDSFVVLTILSYQLGYCPKEALEKAYEEIKNRKGKTIGGVFIKEQDLPDEDK